MKYEYSFSRLTHLTDKLQIRGAVGPMYCAQTIMEQFADNTPYFAVYRVWIRVDGYGNETMYQVREGGRNGIWEMTGYDHLLVCFPGYQIFAIDRGTRCEMIAMCCGEDESDITLNTTISKDYHHTLPEVEIKKLMRQGYNTAMAYAVEFQEEAKAIKAKLEQEAKN